MMSNIYILTTHYICIYIYIHILIYIYIYCICIVENINFMNKLIKFGFYFAIIQRVKYPSNHAGFRRFRFPSANSGKVGLAQTSPQTTLIHPSWILCMFLSRFSLENTMKFPKWDPRSQTPFPLKLAATQHLFDGNPGKLPELLGFETEFYGLYKYKTTTLTLSCWCHFPDLLPNYNLPVQALFWTGE